MTHQPTNTWLILRAFENIGWHFCEYSSHLHVYCHPFVGDFTLTWRIQTASHRGLGASEMHRGTANAAGPCGYPLLICTLRCGNHMRSVRWNTAVLRPWKILSRKRSDTRTALPSAAPTSDLVIHDPKNDEPLPHVPSLVVTPPGDTRLARLWLVAGCILLAYTLSWFILA